LNIGIDDVIGQELLAAVPDVAASTGSACHSGDDQPSASLLALGLAPRQAASALRLSLGRWTTPQQITAAADSLTAALLIRRGA